MRKKQSVNRSSGGSVRPIIYSLASNVSKLISQRMSQTTCLLLAVLVLLLASSGSSQVQPTGNNREQSIGDNHGQAIAFTNLSQEVDVLHYDEIMQIAVGSPPPQGSDIDAFWQLAFPEVLESTQRVLPQVSASTQYVSPQGFYPYDPSDPPETLCAPEIQSWAGNAYYCSLDTSISWDEGWLQGIREEGQEEFTRYYDMVPLTIIAHEWGHHITHLVNPSVFQHDARFPPYSIQYELQADCYAGLYIRYAQDHSEGIQLEVGDVNEAAYAFYLIGDPAFDQARWFDPGVHGRSIERLVAFTSGFHTYNVDYCTSYWNYQSIPDLRLEPYYTLTPLSETTYEQLQEGLYRLDNPRVPFDAYAVLRSDLSDDQPAWDQIDTVAREWLSDSDSVHYLDGFESAPEAPKGTSSTVRYERTYTDESGVQQTEHGAIYLHVREGGGGGIVVDVADSGPAPLDEAGWEDLKDYFIASLNGLQVY